MKLIAIFVATLALIKFTEAARAQNIEVGVYIESLCPDSKRFVNNQLYPVYNALKGAEPQILTINLVPFGNAKMTFVTNSTQHPRLTYTCQHQAQECDGNIIQSCAVIKYSIDKSLGLTDCMFASNDWKTPWKSGAECAQKLGLDFKELSACANSLEGLALQYFMAGQTEALEPKENWIPWVTINGQHSDAMQKLAESNLLKLVCDSYQGSPKPKPCESV